MDTELLKMAEREILTWPGVGKVQASGGMGRGGFRVPPATVFLFDRKHLGHIHDTGMADITVPKRVHERLISDGRARPHPAGFEGVVSLRIETRSDVAKVVDLFRTGYDLAWAAAERRGTLPHPSHQPAQDDRRAP